MHLLHFSVPLLLIAGKALLPTVNYINKLFRPLKHQNIVRLFNHCKTRILNGSPVQNANTK